MNKIRKFALIVAGVYEEYQYGIIEGILNFANNNQVNISCFTGFNDVAFDSKFNIGENFIYTVADYNQFDGFILMINTISDSVTKQKIIEKVKKSQKPAVIFDYSGEPDFINFTIDNYNPMKSMVLHIINKHNAKRLCFIAGPNNNPEAIDRLNAFKDACTECGITDTYIYNGTFRPSDGRNAVKAILKDHFIPNAIISANDAMAISALEELSTRGYKVPEDIIITGFDNTLSAQFSSPSITSVKRPLTDLGYNVCDILFKKIYGEEIHNKYQLKSEVVYGESCGCHIQSYTDLVSYKKMVSYKLTNVNHDILAINSLIPKLSGHNKIESCIDDLVTFSDEINCDKFVLCLYNTSKKSNNHTALVARCGDNISKNLPLSSGELDPIPYSTGGNIDYYFPLHYGNSIIGYIIIGNSDFPLRSFGCHMLSMNISNVIENIYKINNLDKAYAEINDLYMMDQLCGIYNRYGMINASKSILHDCKRRNLSMFISFIDMDGLKTINDRYGHKEGDFSIKTIATALKNSCNASTICARFGGDEFIAIGIGDNPEEFEAIFNNNLEILNHKSKKEYKIQGSIGSIVSKINDNTDIFKLISQADSIMYEQKKRKKTSRYIRKDD